MSNSNEDSIENLNSLRISTFEEHDDHDEKILDTTPQDIDFEDDDDDEDDDDPEPVTLGFVEKPRNRWSLLRQYFPSIAGGVPAWLDPLNLPSGKCCVCDICGNPLQFLLQVYAPISGKESAFHRTLFVFMCPSKTCLLQDQQQWKRGSDKSQRSVKVFRCQLPRANPFYLSEPPRQDGTDKPLGNGAALCNWCGTWKGHKVCSSCRSAYYCSEQHQAMHWKSGHKADCRRITVASESSPSNGRNTLAEIPKVASKTLWPEHEIINEDESEFDIEVSESETYGNSLVPIGKLNGSLPESNLEVDDDKKSWASFQALIAKAPEQVLRYCRSARAKAVWPEASGRVSSSDIPRCNYCGGSQIYEFQILPQLLYYFGVKNDVDSIDWATIVVFTCESSCDGPVAYKEEHVWVQLSS